MCAPSAGEGHREHTDARIESSLKLIDDQLESMDQEEVARLRQRRKDVA